MKESAKNQIQGKAKEISGSIKKQAGQAMNRPGLEEKGRAGQMGGKLQKKVGQLEKVFGK